MKRHTLLLLTLLVPALAAAQADLPITDRVLPNGLHVIVIENHAVPLVTVELGVRNGAFAEPPDFDGLSHLYEHMFFKGNRTIPDQEAYLRRLNQLGAIWNGTTSEEYVNYYGTVGVDSLEPMLQFLEDAIRFPLFQEEEFVRERPVVIGEFDRAEATPGFHLRRGMDTLLWTPQYYSRKNVIGNREVILSATREKMEAVKNQYYVAGNAALILSGDITPERGFDLAAKIFGDWSRGENPFATPVPRPPPLTARKAVIVEQPVNTVVLQLAWHGPSVDADPAATYAADLLSPILSNRASRFHKRLVDSRLAFAAGIGYYTQRNVGPIYASLQTTPDNLFAARDALLEEIEAMASENYFTDDEVADAQRQNTLSAIQERERASEWAHTVGFWWSVAGLDYYRNYVPNIQRVARADLARFVRDYLAGKPYVIGAMLNPTARAQANLTAERLLAGGAR